MLENYNPIMEMVRGLCPSAHIAGGAVRDTLLERPIHDIDLFLDDAVTNDAAKLMRSKFGYVKVGEWAQYLEFSDPAVARVAKFEKADETIPICLIGLKRARGMQENLARFDFGVCMAAWNGNEAYTAPQYRTDINAKTFTLRRADNAPQFAYSMVRFQKMTADRYEGWALAVPNEFKELLKEYTFRKTWYEDYEIGGFKLQGSPQLLKPKAR